MSALHLHARPWTVFNPADDDHRRYYYDFVSTGTWGRCPVRFVVPDAHGDLISMIQRSLIKWYVTNEFNIKTKAKSRARSKH